MLKPKLLFVFDNPNEGFWMDGLWGALNLLEQDFEITKLNLNQLDEREYRLSVNLTQDVDFTLMWGGFHSKVDMWLGHAQAVTSKTKFGLCIGGNAFPPFQTDRFDVLFYETKWYRDQINHHPNIVQAFGVNTDIFFPTDLPTPILYDYIGVGALADWKRWEKMTERGGRRLVVGEYQLGNEPESLRIAQNLLKGGVAVSPMINPFDLAMLYHCSRTLYMPSTIYGGGERSILEAKACGLSVEIEEDNPKLKELAEMEVIPNHKEYARKLKEGILSCLA